MTDSTRRRYNPLDIRPGTAYPQGPRRPKRGPLPPAGPENRMFPAAPGAARSPQVPGQVPDRSNIPGHTQLPLPPATASIPPLTEFGTAQRIMQVFELKPGQEDNPARWEQATASYEEIRKADLSLLPPMRPGPGFNLVEGEVDLAMLPDGEGIAPALPPAAPPQAGSQTVSPSDAAVPDQAQGADAPAPGDPVSTGGTLPAAKATATGGTSPNPPVDAVAMDRPSAAPTPASRAAGAPASDRTTTPDVVQEAPALDQSNDPMTHDEPVPPTGERDQTQPSPMGLAAAPEIVSSETPPVAAGTESIDRVIDETSKPPDDVERAATDADSVADASETAAASARSLPPKLAGLPPGGWVAGDGSSVCPPGYPIKGNANSKIYHEPGQSSYDSTEPEICFESADAAVAAGFRPRKGKGRGRHSRGGDQGQRR